MISAPTLFIGGLLVAAVLVYFVRRVTAVAAPLSAAVASGFAWLVIAVPSTSDESILGGWISGGDLAILGRTLALPPADRYTLAFCGVVVAVLCLVAGGLSGSAAAPGSRPARPGDVFFPGVLALLGVAAAALMLETFVFGVLLVEIAAGVTTVLLQGTRFGSTRGAWRFFLIITLALPLLLTAGWLIDTQAANPRQTDLLNPAVLLLTLGFAIYLSAVPFHLWMAPSAGDASPLVQVVILGLFPLITVSVVCGAFGTFPWFAVNSIPYQWFTFLGTITVGLGGVLAFSSQSFGKLSAYSVLVDIGGMLLLMGLRQPQALQASWLLALSRTASVTLFATGLAIVRSQTGSDRMSAAVGLGRRLPLVTALLLYGALSLGGFPLTPGFAGRWLAVAVIGRSSIGRAVLLLAGSAGSVVGVMRAARALFAAPPDAESVPSTARPGWPTVVILVLLALGALVLSVYPHPFAATAVQISSYFTSVN